MSFDGQFSKSSDENEYLNPHSMVILKEKSGIKYYSHSNNHGKNSELQVSQRHLAAINVSGAPQGHKDTHYPKLRGNLIVRLMLPKKQTQVDKYQKTHRIRRIYTRIVLVTMFRVVTHQWHLCYY